MKTAVVILNYNGKPFLEQFLPTLISYTINDETQIYIADNQSSDDSLTFLKEYYPQLPVILLDKNYGFAGGYNKALEKIEAKYYLLLNSDVAVSKNWLTPLVSYMDSNAEVAACQPKIKSFHQPKYFEHAGAAGGFIDKFGYPFCRGRIFNSLEEDNGQYENIIDIFWASGACLLIRSDIFWEVGAFDEEFFAHMEEIDLCWRIINRQKRIVCIPQSTVYHVGGGTLKTENPYKTYLNFRNNLIMLYKNLPKEKLKRLLLIRWGLDYLAAIVMILQGKMANAKSVWRARADYRKMKSNFKTKRKDNLQRKGTFTSPLIFQKSIVWTYYYKNRKIFSSLPSNKKLPNYSV